MLSQNHASLTIPNFLKGKLLVVQFSPDEIVHNERIVSVRIHVERYIRTSEGSKSTNYLSQVCIPLSLVGTVPQLWTVAEVLGNFQVPLIRETSSSVD